MRKLFVVAVAALGMSVAGMASAATQTVNYTLVPSAPGSVAAPNTSHFDSLTPTVTTNLGPITGTAQITYEVTALNTPPPTGSVTVDSLVSDTNLGAAGYGGAALGLVGLVHAVLVNPVTTTQTGGVLAAAPGTLHLSGTITCTPNDACQFLGVPPSTTLNVDEPAQIGGTGATDLSWFATTTPLTTVLGALTTTGNAILYGVVPEPGTLLLLGAGIAGLAAFGRRRNS